MTDHVPPIARVRLARAPLRLLVVPGGLALLATILGAVAALVPALPMPLAIGIGAVATLLGLAAVAVAAWLFSLRLSVEEAALRLTWIGGERVYPLTPGPVTRVRLQGEQASRLRARTDALGWAVGRAVLRDEEDVEVVRLASTSTAILVPTERGRLAIAAATESELIDALSRAAQARQRLDVIAPPPERTPADEGTTDASDVGAAATAVPEAPDEQPPRFLTGIERALMEERLAREVAEATAAAEAAREAAEAAAPATEEEDGVEAGDAPAGAAGALVPAAASAPATASARRWSVGEAASAIGRSRPSAAFVLLPLVGSGVVWGAATLLDRLPDAGSDMGRLTALALVLAGPATSVGAIMARAWWPRLVGVVVSSGLAASVFIGRAILSV